VTASITSGEEVRAGSLGYFATVQGVTQTVPEVFNRPIDEGAYLTKADVDTSARVVVLGADVAGSLFPGEDPVGRPVTIAGVRFRVVGVAVRRGSAFGVSQDSQVDIPITAAQRLFGVSAIQGLAVKAPTPDRIGPLSDELVAALQAKYPGEQFSAVTQDQILGTIGKILSLLTLVLAAIAGISLLVGGVGVSNIMLVGVRERTREIGLRKALGARRSDIMAQMLTESVVLSMFGGVIGTILGAAIAMGISSVTPVPASIEPWSVVLGIGITAIVGLFFGLYPAMRAAALDPIEALRRE